jgi:hypothetical protein
MKHFITFGAGEQNFIDAGNRLVGQAESTGKFDSVRLFTDIDLKDDTEFWPKHSEFILKNRRGYGYWIWKPYLIKRTMDALVDGDILLYLDSGCEIDARFSNHFDKLFDIVKKDYIIGSKVCIERVWNKMDLIVELDMLDDKHLNSLIRQGGTNMFYVCDKTRELVRRWYELACNYHFIDDSPSILPNLPDFKEHRHDQSIFSLLTKKMGLFSKEGLGPVIKIYRNKTGTSKLK